MISHQDGLLRVVFNQWSFEGGLSSKRSLIRVVFHQGGLLRVVFHYGGLLRVVFYEGGLLRIDFHHGGLLRVVFYQGVILRVVFYCWSLDGLLGGLSPRWSLEGGLFTRVVSLGWSFIGWSFIWVSLEGGLSARWSLEGGLSSGWSFDGGLSSEWSLEGGVSSGWSFEGGLLPGWSPESSLSLGWSFFLCAETLWVRIPQQSHHFLVSPCGRRLCCPPAGTGTGWGRIPTPRGRPRHAPHLPRMLRS